MNLSNLSPSPLNNPSVNPLTGNVVQPSTSKPKTRNAKSQSTIKPMLTSSNYHSLNPSADLRLPAEIFASDDSVSDPGMTNQEELHNVLNELTADQITSTKDRLLGGINIKVEKPDPKPCNKKSKKSRDMNIPSPNLADIKTELQDDLDWNDMTLATLNSNNNVGRFQSRYSIFCS